MPGGLSEPTTMPLMPAKTSWRRRAASRRWRSSTSTWMSSMNRMWRLPAELGRHRRG
ncbi:MAG: hypothetical protein M0C28_20905 [Candidatus Moduliflexus flocculans]|nr:hypothetical protein [Candidatus Moduliflexus flocculans]